MLRLLLPALIPSWRFFDFIAPSPRIEVALLTSVDDVHPLWRAFQPRPERLSALQLLLRLLWNPRWNEYLFLSSCAEKVVQNSSDGIAGELLNHVAEVVEPDPGRKFLQLRIVVVKREGSEVTRSVGFVSKIISVERQRDL